MSPEAWKLSWDFESKALVSALVAAVGVGCHVVLRQTEPSGEIREGKQEAERAELFPDMVKASPGPFELCFIHSVIAGMLH